MIPVETTIYLSDGIVKVGSGEWRNWNTFLKPLTSLAELRLGIRGTFFDELFEDPNGYFSASPLMASTISCARVTRPRPPARHSTPHYHSVTDPTFPEFCGEERRGKGFRENLAMIWGACRVGRFPLSQVRLVRDFPLIFADFVWHDNGIVRDKSIYANLHNWRNPLLSWCYLLGVET